jgi:hypothetical protein
MSPADKALEKDRLQNLVKSFARTALLGATCTLLDVAAQSHVAASYTLDRQLQRLHFANVDGGPSVACDVPMSEIDEMLAYRDLSQEAQKVLNLFLTDQECRCHLLLRANIESKLQEVQLLFEDAASKDEFMTCVKILRLYCQKDSARLV